jgi:hypothetical protein
MRVLSAAIKTAMIAAILLPVGCGGGEGTTSPSLGSKPPVAYAQADQYHVDPGDRVCFVDYEQTSGGGMNRSLDPDGTIMKWEWDFSYDVRAGFVAESAIMHPCVEFERKGFYQVQLRVTDNSGNTDMLDTPLLIDVGMGYVPPVAIAVAEPLVASPGQLVHFWDDGSYDPDGGAISVYEWDWNNDGAFDQQGAEAWRAWTNPGTYNVQFRVTDDESETDTLDQPLVITVTLGGVPPVAMAIAEPLEAGLGEQVHFRDNGSYDPDGGSIMKYEWDWDNGGTFDEEGAETYHAWTTPGTYPVQFRVTDNEGQSDTLDIPLMISVVTRGELIWAKRAGGVNWDDGCGITALSNGSTVVTGAFYGSAIFGAGEPNETTLKSNGCADILWADVFVARYNPDGSLAWVKRAGGSRNDEGFGITALSDDSTVITGFNYGPATFGIGEPNETTLYATGNDIFIARYYPDGGLAWAKRAGGGFSDCGAGIIALSDNSTVVTGYFEEAATFGVGESNEATLYSNGYSDVFVARYNPDGSLAWAKRAGGYDESRGSEITALSDDSTGATGYFFWSAVFGAGEPNETTLSADGGSDIFIARHNPDGSLAWARRAGASFYGKGFGITALSDDSTVLTGYFRYSATFGIGEPNETTLSSYGWEDIFIARYKPDGSLAWAKRAGGTDWDQGRAITALSDDSTVVTGAFCGSATFGAGEPNETTIASDDYYYLDIFIARYDPDGSLAWVRRAGSCLNDQGLRITALSDDSTVLTGYFRYSATFGIGEPNETTLTSDGNADIFIARFYP